MKGDKELIDEIVEVHKGCGKKLDYNGDCAYQGRDVWRMCNKCKLKLAKLYGKQMGRQQATKEYDVKFDEFVGKLKEICNLYKHEGMCKLCKEDAMVDYNSDCDSCKIDKLSKGFKQKGGGE